MTVFAPILTIVAVLLVARFGTDLLGDKEPKKPDPKPGPPPVEFSFRKSKIPLQGMVAGVWNTSEQETLESLVVRVSSPEEEGERSHHLWKTLRPQDSITVGWQELDGWKLKPDDVLKITCDQYRDEVFITIPQPRTQNVGLAYSSNTQTDSRGLKFV
ncbi:MAG: hypothetical protein KDA84_05860 [Planctomycetaceae bacterium]|nr:hypothetical protein [Planctomycetaceae bacterium]